MSRIRRGVVRTARRSIGSVVVAAATPFDSGYWADDEAVQRGVTPAASALCSSLVLTWILDAYTGYSLPNSMYGLALVGAGATVFGGAVVQLLARELSRGRSGDNSSLALPVQVAIGVFGAVGGCLLWSAVTIVDATRVELAFIPDIGPGVYSGGLIVCLLVLAWLEGMVAPILEAVISLAYWLLASVLLTTGAQYLFGSAAGGLVFLGTYLVFSLYPTGKALLPIVAGFRWVVVEHVVPAARAEFRRQ